MFAAKKAERVPPLRRAKNQSSLQILPELQRDVRPDGCVLFCLNLLPRPSIRECLHVKQIVRGNKKLMVREKDEVTDPSIRNSRGCGAQGLAKM